MIGIAAKIVDPVAVIDLVEVDPAAAATLADLAGKILDDKLPVGKLQRFHRGVRRNSVDPLFPPHAEKLQGRVAVDLCYFAIPLDAVSYLTQLKVSALCYDRDSIA